MTNQNSKPQKSEKSSGDEIDVGKNVSNSVIVTGSGNTVNIRKNDKSKTPEKNKSKKSNPLIAVAWIGFWGAVLAALISVIGNNPNFNFISGTAGAITETVTYTFTPSPVPTDTVPPGQPTSTPIHATNTPEPTFTPIAPVPIGEDWMQGCISKLWSTYPSTIQTEDRNDGCWKEPVHAFSAENGDLDFLFERPSGAEEIYGLFAPLPTESGTLTLTIRLRDLSNADLLIGIFSQPEVKSQGLLMMMLNGGVDSNVFIQKDPFTYETILGSQRIFQGNGYSITFHFDNLSVRSVVNPFVFFVDPFSLPSSQKYLFLGYKGLRGYYRIEGTFLNFELKE